MIVWYFVSCMISYYCNSIESFKSPQWYPSGVSINHILLWASNYLKVYSHGLVKSRNFRKEETLERKNYIMRVSEYTSIDNEENVSIHIKKGVNTSRTTALREYTLHSCYTAASTETGSSVHYTVSTRVPKTRQQCSNMCMCSLSFHCTMYMLLLLLY